MTNIEWTHRKGTTGESWNPVTGCTKISPGCKHCYAERMARRLAGRYGYPKDEPFKVTVHPDKLNKPLRWRKPRTVFVCSMGDLFHDDVPDRFIFEVFQKMAITPKHTYLVLTKRLERWLWLMIRGWQNIPPSLPNVWLGGSIENQEQADERIPILLQIPAAVRFVSIEPMLGEVDVNDWLALNYESRGFQTEREILGGPRHHGLDWVIVGGETGPGARPMDPQWARDIRDQCAEAGVSFFFKQMTNRVTIPDDLLIHEWPA